MFKILLFLKFNNLGVMNNKKNCLLHVRLTSSMH